MNLTFPLTMTVDEIAALPGAADIFGWELVDKTNFPEYISHFLNCELPPMMQAFLDIIGFRYDETGFTAREPSSIIDAHRLFKLVMFEYDEFPLSDKRKALNESLGNTFPLWFVLGLGGDDSYDYCGSMPSHLTELLLSLK